MVSITAHRVGGFADLEGGWRCRRTVLATGMLQHPVNGSAWAFASGLELEG